MAIDNSSRKFSIGGSEIDTLLTKGERYYRSIQTTEHDYCGRVIEVRKEKYFDFGNSYQLYLEKIGSIDRENESSIYTDFGNVAEEMLRKHFDLPPEKNGIKAGNLTINVDGFKEHKDYIELIEYKTCSVKKTQSDYLDIKKKQNQKKKPEKEEQPKSKKYQPKSKIKDKKTNKMVEVNTNPFYYDWGKKYKNQNQIQLYMYVLEKVFKKPVQTKLIVLKRPELLERNVFYGETRFLQRKHPELSDEEIIAMDIELKIEKEKQKEKALLKKEIKNLEMFLKNGYDSQYEIMEFEIEVDEGWRKHILPIILKFEKLLAKHQEDCFMPIMSEEEYYEYLEK